MIKSRENWEYWYWNWESTKRSSSEYLNSSSRRSFCLDVCLLIKRALRLALLKLSLLYLRLIIACQTIIFSFNCFMNWFKIILNLNSKFEFESQYLNYLKLSTIDDMLRYVRRLERDVICFVHKLLKFYHYARRWAYIVSYTWHSMQKNFAFWIVQWDDEIKSR